MSIESEFEQEEQRLSDQLNNCEISEKEFNKEMAELQREFRDMARESAQEAYDNELESWGY